MHTILIPEPDTVHENKGPRAGSLPQFVKLVTQIYPGGKTAMRLNSSLVQTPPGTTQTSILVVL